MLRYLTTRIRPVDGTVALQIPVAFQGVRIATPGFIARAHSDGYAVHVWFSGTATEDEATYRSLIEACADGLMSSRPTLLERVLDDVSFTAPDRSGETVTINAAYVRGEVESLAKNTDLSRFIL